MPPSTIRKPIRTPRSSRPRAAPSEHPDPPWQPVKNERPARNDFSWAFFSYRLPHNSPVLKTRAQRAGSVSDGVLLGLPVAYASGSLQGFGRMKIQRIRAYQVDLPLHEGSYKWSGGKSVTVFDSTVIEVETDAGVTGWGEVCPAGTILSRRAYANGVRAGIAELGPHLLGRRPARNSGALNNLMDAAAARGMPMSSRASTWPAGTSSARSRASRCAFY